LGGGSSATGDIVVGGFMPPPQSDDCNMEPQLTCNPTDTQGKCNWKDGACVSIETSDGTSNMGSTSNSTSLPSECLLLPNYLVTYLEQEYSNPSISNMIDTICNIPPDIIQSVDNTGLSDDEKINDILCIAKNLSGGVSACPQDNCFYNSNIIGNCRSKQARDFLRSLVSVENQVEYNPAPTVRYQMPNEQPLTEPVLLTEAATKVNVRGEYSDQDCKTLSSRGFDVVCTYNNNRNDESVFHLDREIDTQKKRYVFFND
jgi:hypothetical protein